MLAIVKSVEKKAAKNGTNFFGGYLRVKGGQEISFKMWDVGQAEGPEVGTIMECVAQQDEYNGKPQITIKEWHPVEGPGAHVFAEFLPHTKFDPNVMYQELQQIIGQEMEDPERAVCFEAIKLHKEKFMQAPAANNHHHAWIGGLLEHIHQLCHQWLEINKYYPHVNKSQVYFGLIMHDFCKIFEYRWDRGIFETSAAGHYMGHIGQAPHFLGRIMDGLNIPDEQQYPLIHIVLAHHGVIEWGSPVLPCTSEALVVHYMDNFHAQTYAAKGFLDQQIERGKKPGEFTERHYLHKAHYLIPSEKLASPVDAATISEEEIPF
jgi:3'-5' exoribonuclease